MRISKNSLIDLISYLMDSAGDNGDYAEIDFKFLRRRNWEVFFSPYNNKSNFNTHMMRLDKNILRGYIAYLVKRYKSNFDPEINIQDFHIWNRIHTEDEKKNYINNWLDKRSWIELVKQNKILEEKYIEKERKEAHEREERRKEELRQHAKALNKLKSENPEKYLEAIKEREFDDVRIILIQQCPQCNDSHEYEIGIIRSRVNLIKGISTFPETVKETVTSILLFPFEIISSIKLRRGKVDDFTNSPTYVRLFFCPVTEEIFQAEFSLSDHIEDLSDVIVLGTSLKGKISNEK